MTILTWILWKLGWATALIVLGPEAAQRVAQKQGLAVYFIQRDGEEYSHSYTAAFRQYLPDATD